MQDLSLHILDIVENSLNAGSFSIDVRIIEDRPENLLTLEISDDGAGMDETALKRALDPFYTSKHNGVGLGLSVSRKIVQAHNGLMEVDSEPGRGATFTIVFPGENLSGAKEASACPSGC